MYVGRPLSFQACLYRQLYLTNYDAEKDNKVFLSRNSPVNCHQTIIALRSSCNTQLHPQHDIKALGPAALVP